MDQPPCRVMGPCGGADAMGAVINPLVPQCTPYRLLNGARHLFMAPGAPDDAADPVQGEVVAEAGVAPEDGHEWRWRHVLHSWPWASHTSGH